MYMLVFSHVHIYTYVNCKDSLEGAARRGAWGGVARRGATARGGEGGSGGKPQKIIQSPEILYKAPTDNTKPRQALQNPQKTIGSLWILDKTSKC